MLFSTTFSAIAASLVSLAVVQATVVTVQVGASADNFLQFIPSTVTAAKGDIVSFVFSGVPGNHTVTQSTFQDPCTPLANGFDSGWVLRSGPGNAPVWNVTITDDSKPIWYFCKALQPATHCATGGMVGAINAPATGNTFPNFQKAALASGTVPPQGGQALVGVGASASAAPGPIGTGAAVAGGAPTAPAGSSPTNTAAPTATTTAAGKNAGFAAVVPFGGLLSTVILAVAFL